MPQEAPLISLQGRWLSNYQKRVVRQALQSPALVKRFEGEGAIPDASTPQELAMFIDAELLKWAAVVARTPIKVD